MSRFVDDAKAALDRWRQVNEGSPPPPVRVFVRGGHEYRFNGLSIAPAGISTGAVALSAAGTLLPVVVLRDEDIERIEINEVGPGPFGFAKDD